MSNAQKSNSKPWSRFLNLLRKIDRSLPFVSPFAVFPGRSGYRIFLNGNTILVERPRKRRRPATGSCLPRDTPPTTHHPRT